MNTPPVFSSSSSHLHIHSGCGWPPCRVSEFRGALPLPRFLVFLRYQVYYEYPLLTYLEYPILIAQGDEPPSPASPALPWAPPPSHTKPFPPDFILLLCVFRFNGNVYRVAPYVALYPSASEGGDGPYSAGPLPPHPCLLVSLKKIPNADSMGAMSPQLRDARLSQARACGPAGRVGGGLGAPCWACRSPPATRSNFSLGGDVFLSRKYPHRI